MQTILLALFLLLLSMGALAIGVLFGRRPIEGSCAGIACNNACSSCGRRAGQ